MPAMLVVNMLGMAVRMCFRHGRRMMTRMVVVIVRMMIVPVTGVVVIVVPPMGQSGGGLGLMCVRMIMMIVMRVAVIVMVMRSVIMRMGLAPVQRRPQALALGPDEPCAQQRDARVARLFDEACGVFHAL